MAAVAVQRVLADYKNFTDLRQLRDWQAANAIDGFALYLKLANLDAAARANGSAILSKVFDLVQTTPDPANACLGGWGGANDDEQWAIFAWVRAYGITNDWRMIVEAAKYHDWVTKNEAVWRGGVNGTRNLCGALGFHNTPAFGPNRQDFKNTITNTQMLTSSMLLHPFAQRLGKPAGYYLGIAKSTWAWLESYGLRNLSSGLWLNGLNMSSCRADNLRDPGQTWPCSYNQGIVLSGLVRLANVTGNHTLLGVVCDGIDAVARQMTSTAAGTRFVLHEVAACDTFWGGPCRRWAIFKGAFMRSLSDIAPFLATAAASSFSSTSVPAQCIDTMHKLIGSSARSAWSHGRCLHAGKYDDGSDFSYDWTGRRADFNDSCDRSTPFTNVLSQNAAAADLMTALLAAGGGG